MEYKDIIDLVVAFGSLVLIPFLGVLDIFKINIFNILAIILCIWFFFGLILIAGGVTPVGPGDFIMPEERRAWFASPFVVNTTKVWALGFIIGIPFLILSWLHQKRTFSTLWRSLDAFTKIIVFIGGLRTFVQKYWVVLP